jgi:hypothetical protein
MCFRTERVAAICSRAMVYICTPALMFHVADHISFHRICIKYDCDETVKNHNFLVGYAVCLGSSDSEY